MSIAEQIYINRILPQYVQLNIILSAVKCTISFQVMDVELMMKNVINLWCNNVKQIGVYNRNLGLNRFYQQENEIFFISSKESQ